MTNNSRYTNKEVQYYYTQYIKHKTKYLLGKISRNDFGNECIYIFDELMDTKGLKGCDDITFYKEAMDLIEIMSAYMFYTH